MNQKQLITMWCGIAAIALAGLTAIENYGLVCPYGFSVWVFIVALVTGSLIYTFKGQKAKAKNIDTIQEVRDDILKRRRIKREKTTAAKANSENSSMPGRRAVSSPKQ
ncbi:MAG: hypothetical protein PHY02_01055 [Phycisphaerae bacterium]|nr:hypothetical protein [Phycisphaerae bacterium]